MSRKLKKATESWLDIERRGSDASAERALLRVFRALPVPAPSPELARRTLAQLGLAPLTARPASQSGHKPHWAYRWAVATALALSGLATVLYAPALLSSLSLKGSANWIVDVGAGFLAAVSRRLAAGYTLWDVIGRAGATAAEVVATPQVLGFMFATVLFGLATFRVLAGLVAVERSSYHA
ncbi:MAG: hypothetical protein GY769_12895 [bacterium]|nr:hypothetical protein [bacterium]